MEIPRNAPDESPRRDDDLIDGTLAQRDLREEKMITGLLRATDKWEAANAIQPEEACPNDKRVWRNDYPARRTVHNQENGQTQV